MFKLTSLKLVDQLKQKAAEMRGRNLSAAITVPEELKWWYYQEFGTVGPYTIAPRDGEMLKLPEKGDFPIFHKAVTHPGVRAKHFIKKVEPEIQQMAAHKLAEALSSSGYDPDAAHSALLQDVMPEVVNLISGSMETNLGHSREDGKLHGENPADAYRDGAEIVDKSS